MVLKFESRFQKSNVQTSFCPRRKRSSFLKTVPGQMKNAVKPMDPSIWVYKPAFFWNLVNWGLSSSALYR
ncbi:hypothetical protein LEP1GSC060_2651 [Leptospira weilii serovar Ranarum str. ICFT]|uniref:Uncharacterized protein n=1 Tax=Leptospira weilii serovar Ranarum str. ICFT TaxID=1218598 RepID=N1WLB5_9LEPT|nr:hypothetical protein LEP1GSC060_2651 [Leptospira weilii serovar Ranarum str. ICFT]